MAFPAWIPQNRLRIAQVNLGLEPLKKHQAHFTSRVREGTQVSLQFLEETNMKVEKL